MDYRCPAEPVAVYTGRKGGRAANTEGRRCLCNGLVAAAGLAQVRRNGGPEPVIITSGDDFRAVAELAPETGFYTAADVLNYLQSRR